MTITKMERSNDDATLLVSDSVYGATIFWAMPEQEDQELIDQHINSDLGIMVRWRTYAEYKSDANDWRTIYEAEA